MSFYLKPQLKKIVMQYAKELDMWHLRPRSLSNNVKILAHQEMLGAALDSLYALSGYERPIRQFTTDIGRTKLHFNTARGRFIEVDKETGEMSIPKPEGGARFIQRGGFLLRELAYWHHTGIKAPKLLVTVTGNPHDLRWCNLMEWDWGNPPESIERRVRKRLKMDPV